jgi:hypothetical protein
MTVQGDMATMTRAKRIAMIQRDMRIARAEQKWDLVRQLIDELCMVCKGAW